VTTHRIRQETAWEIRERSSASIFRIVFEETAMDLRGSGGTMSPEKPVH
jgi:hypothetical protein